MDTNGGRVTPTNEDLVSTSQATTSNLKPCSECGTLGLGSFYRKQIRRLHEKLEYSELQRLKLSSECKRLRKELQEAEFRGRSRLTVYISPRNTTETPCSVSRTFCPSIPNEVLHQIFSSATHLEGDLVSPHWRVEEPYPPWVESLQARRSIPLVCRQWHIVGLQYLYQHIVIHSESRLSKLLRTMESFTRIKDLLAERSSWIRGLEFILFEERDGNGITHSFARDARDLISIISPGRLRIFGVENGECSRSSDRRVIELIADGLHKSDGSLESLHLPCVSAQEDAYGRLVYKSRNGTFILSATGSTALSNLQTLSLTSGRWELCAGRRRADQEMISFLTNNIHSIHTIHLNWLRVDYRTIYWAFLHTAVANLRTVHIIIGRKPVLEDLDDFLESLPQLRSLIITPSNHGLDTPVALRANVLSHQSLGNIVLVMDSSSAYKCIFQINPIFSKIQSGRLPGLKRVVVRGPYPEGCLDCRGVFPVKHGQCWKDAIEACAERNVDLVGEEGRPIHLWSSQHGVRCEIEEEGAESDASSFDEEEWWELSTSEYSGSSVEDDVISNDSEDSPYRYVSHPDLEYDSGSEESE